MPLRCIVVRAGSKYLNPLLNPMRAAPPVALSRLERAELEHWARGRSVSVRCAERARIVLLAAENRTNKAIAARLHLSPVTVRRWRSRFALLGMNGIARDAPRSGHKSGAGPVTMLRIIERTRFSRPRNGIRWTTRTLAKELGVSHTTIGNAWRSFGVRPPRYRRWRLSPDPRYLDRHVDVAGIFVNPPGTLVALSVEPWRDSSRLPATAARPAGIEETESEKRGVPAGRSVERLAEILGTLDGVPPSAASWRLTSRELLLFLESLNERSLPMSEIHLLTGASSLAWNERVTRWIDRHPRFHLGSPAADRPISTVVRDWFLPERTLRPDASGLSNLPLLERLLGSYLDGVTLFGRPFAWTRTGTVSHWRATPDDTFPISNSNSAHSSLRSRSRSG